MKLFVSWSGDLSKAVAELFSEWIESALQGTVTWLSTNNLDAGSVWFNEIADKLRDNSFGLICLTRENRERPWILFEAGALMKGLASSRLFTVLIDLDVDEVDGPLAAFNHTKPDENGLRKLIRTINARSTSPLSEKVIDTVFRLHWPEFEGKLAKIRKDIASAPKPPPPSTEALLQQVIEMLKSAQPRQAAVTQQSVFTLDGAAISKSEVKRHLLDFISDLLTNEFTPTDVISHAASTFPMFSREYIARAVFRQERLLKESSQP